MFEVQAENSLLGQDRLSSAFMTTVAQRHFEQPLRAFCNISEGLRPSRKGRHSIFYCAPQMLRAPGLGEAKDQQ
jgi:hypothetical protein